MAIIAIRTVIIYIFVIIAMRIMGKRQLGEMQPAELVVTLIISDLAAVPMQENGLPLASGIVPVVILVSLEILLSGIMLKIPSFRRLIGGRPKILVDNGKVDGKAMRDLRLTMEDLMESLRQEGAFDLREVQYAIVEANGKVSVLLKPDSRPLTGKDMELQPTDLGMPMVVVHDGTVSRWGMETCGLDDAWLEGVLKKNNVMVEDIFVMTADRTRAYSLSLYRDAGLKRKGRPA